MNALRLTRPAASGLRAAFARTNKQAPTAAAANWFSTEVSTNEDGVHVITNDHVVDTLEWVLDSPPPLHQFDESPIVVEIEHL